MTDPAPEPEQTPAAPDPANGQQEPAEQSGANREAAKYRTQLREAQTANETLTARVEQLHRREVDRLATDRLAQPGDLFDIGGTTLADLLDDQGDVDPTKVDTAIAALLNSRPGLAVVTRTTPDFGAGHRGRGHASGSTKWGDVIGRERRD